MDRPDDIMREAFNAIDALARRATVPFVVEKNGQAESIGTGTLFEVGGQYFVVTAEHVARHIGPYELGIPSGEQRRELWFREMDWLRNSSSKMSRSSGSTTTKVSLV
jgi:hypothetical protein